jgi:cytochrome P450
MKQEYPDGPRINFPLAIAAQMLPAFFKFDPLAFGLEMARKYGDIARYHLGPLRMYQLNHPDLVRQILVATRKVPQTEAGKTRISAVCRQRLTHKRRRIMETTAQAH